MAYAPTRGRTPIQVGAVVVVLALLAGAVVLRDQALTAQMIRDGLNLAAVGA